MTKYSLIIILLTLFAYPWQLLAANKCQSYRDKLDQIQIKQKQGHSAKKSVSLQEQEKKAWQKWMACKQGKLPSTTKKTTKKVADEVVTQAPKKFIPVNTGAPFQSKQALVIKGAYQGIKQQAWLDFYQPLKKCKKPKNTQEFAFCLDDKENQQEKFEAQYQIE